MENNVFNQEQIDNRDFKFSKKMLHMIKVGELKHQIDRYNFSDMPNQITFFGEVALEKDWSKAFKKAE